VYIVPRDFSVIRATSQTLFEQLFERALELITPIRKNMKNVLMRPEDKLLLRKRFISVGPLGPR
jgi:hypothetical protein